VLIDRVQNDRRKRGLGTYDALIEGGRTRLRPILMTAIATILALVPLAVGLSEGAIIASDLAIVVIGGLTTSTLLTLIVVPVMYDLLDRFDRRNQKGDQNQGNLSVQVPDDLTSEAGVDGIVGTELAHQPAQEIDQQEKFAKKDVPDQPLDNLDIEDHDGSSVDTQDE